jgi:hypothetical protein
MNNNYFMNILINYNNLELLGLKKLIQNQRKAFFVVSTKKDEKKD